MPQTVYLALGTNLGDRLQNLCAALEAMPPEIRLKVASPVYETEPWGYLDQPPFLNLVVCAETDLAPLELLRRLKEIESDQGRVTTFRNGPRKIDLDILFYGALTLESEALVIPHPRLAERAFVLVPLAAIAPNLAHPRLGRSVAQLLETVDRRGVSLFAGCIPPEICYTKVNLMEVNMDALKPLNWKPKPGIGYSVARRADGGMNLTFTDLAEATLADWHAFSLEHLFDSDRLTRNLYDLRDISEFDEKAIRMAVEVNSDPATRNLRVAVLVATETARESIMKVAAGAVGSGAAIRIFTSMAEAEAWLMKPIEQMG